MSSSLRLGEDTGISMLSIQAKNPETGESRPVRYFILHVNGLKYCVGIADRRRNLNNYTHEIRFPESLSVATGMMKGLDGKDFEDVYGDLEEFTVLTLSSSKISDLFRTFDDHWSHRMDLLREFVAEAKAVSPTPLASHYTSNFEDILKDFKDVTGESITLGTVMTSPNLTPLLFTLAWDHREQAFVILCSDYGISYRYYQNYSTYIRHHARYPEKSFKFKVIGNFSMSSAHLLHLARAYSSKLGSSDNLEYAPVVYDVRGNFLSVVAPKDCSLKTLNLSWETSSESFSSNSDLVEGVDSVNGFKLVPTATLNDTILCVIYGVEDDTPLQLPEDTSLFEGKLGYVV